MKRHVVSCIILLIQLFGISGITISLEAAEVIYVEGAVEVKPAGVAVWHEANRGMKVDIGDSIRTAKESKADVALDEERKNVIRVESSTLVVLNSVSPALIDRMDLSYGKVYSNLEGIKAGLTFEVSTPSSVVGVRGTAWVMQSHKKRDEVAVYEDDVYVKTFDANKRLISEITIPEGYRAFIKRFKAASELIELSETEMQRWFEIKADIYKHVEEAKRRLKELMKPASFPEEIVEQIDKQIEEKEKASELEEQIEERSVGGHAY